MTRSGYVSAFRTDAGPCTSSSSPRYHHDVANSGDSSRDAILPGAPMAADLAGGTVSFKAPGDDLLCGEADHYDLVTSASPITAAHFRTAPPLPAAPAPPA